MFAQILNEAIETGDMQAALNRQGKLVYPKERQILLSLTPQELKYLSSFRRKLAQLGVVAPE